MSQKSVHDHVDTASFLHTLENHFNTSQIEEIAGALDWAIMAHEGQTRKYEGIPYITHPMAVALDVAQKYEDKELVLAALLHDIVEDCDVRFQEVYTRYGKAVGYMVEAVSKAPLFFIDQPEVIYADKIEKLLAGGMKDVRVLLLKIADRDHNLKSIEGLKPNKQIRMTFETQAIYEPLKNILHCKELDACEDKLKLLIRKNKISNPNEFKILLFSKTYDDFDNETFNLAYSNTDKIVWQIEDRKWFNDLLEIKNFSNSIAIVNLESDGKEFIVRFYFNYGAVIPFEKGNKITPSFFYNNQKG